MAAELGPAQSQLVLYSFLVKSYFANTFLFVFGQEFNIRVTLQCTSPACDLYLHHTHLIAIDLAQSWNVDMIYLTGCGFEDLDCQKVAKNGKYDEN